MTTPSRRDRIRGTALMALAATIIVGPLGLVGYSRAVDRARAEIERAATGNVDAASMSMRLEDGPTPANTWIVNVDGPWWDTFGDTWIEPPLQSLGDAGLDGEHWREFDIDGPLLAYARGIGNNESLVTVVDRSSFERDRSSARWRWLAMGLMAIAALTAVAWWLLGRRPAPVHIVPSVGNDFVADAAHELRTPLSIIQASAGHALARERDAAAYRESLSEILDAAERAGSSVGELLEFARLQDGQAQPRLAPLRLDLLVEEVAASVRVDDVTITAVPGNAAVVNADYHLIRQVVDNITRNAAARATVVTLSTRLDETFATIEVSDNGPGFDPGMIDHVFERFRRGDRSGAVGLGMAIARSIVELHGGTCAAENAESGGARVSVRLPLA
ncbi:MAG: HAMP domain-containing sensor histidine kinase [Acidimicrobiales bacterium]